MGLRTVDHLLRSSGSLHLPGYTLLHGLNRADAIAKVKIFHILVHFESDELGLRNDQTDNYGCTDQCREVYRLLQNDLPARHLVL